MILNDLDRLKDMALCVGKRDGLLAAMKLIKEDPSKALDKLSELFEEEGRKLNCERAVNDLKPIES